MAGQNRKQVNAILRKVAKNLERANKRAVTCWSCKTRIEKWQSYCAECGVNLDVPSQADPPFACPPDEEAK
jgi:predicted amidophosphoribosyltransferase